VHTHTHTHTHTLTSLHHPAKHSVVPVQRAAVPAVVSELVLALLDPLLGALADGLHEVRVALAQLPLLVHQAGNVVADHPSTQRPDVPADTAVMGVSSKNKIKGGPPWLCVLRGHCTAALEESILRKVTRSDVIRIISALTRGGRGPRRELCVRANKC